ncbi:MAG: hypothetical protein JRG91_18400 [Deltaproteobacteria bacterium]|nr:hypothetical protein [Deltaproteobacteria bacterium]
MRAFVLVSLLLAACGHVAKSDECDTGEVECTGACTDLMTDPDNCGACGSRCQLAAHSDPACTGGHCTLECHEGWHDVDGDYLTGWDILPA